MASENPTENTAPVANTTAGKWTFSETCREHIAIDNDSVGAEVYVKFYSTAEEFTNRGAASASEYDYRLKDTTSVGGPVENIYVNGVLIVSAWIATGGTEANFKINGH